MQYTREAFGTCLEIIIKQSDNDSGISESFSIIEDFENKYSRFIDGNILWEINEKKRALLEPEIASLIRLCVKISAMTQGSFDMTLLPFLENAGYGVARGKVPEDFGYKNIILEGNLLTLKNNVSIELGSCGKWYMLDRIYEVLKKYHTNFVVNFWGDIRVCGSHKIHLEDPNNTQKDIWIIKLSNLSIASSAGNKRKMKSWHHLINMKNKVSQDDKIAIYVTHKLWVFADSFATALFVTPLHLSLKILESVEWLEALIIGSDWKIFKTQGFSAELTL